MAAITKSKDWQYEKEWRLVFSPLEGTEQYGHFKVSVAKAIYLGVRFNENKEEDIRALQSISEQYEIPLIKMQVHKTDYKIVQES